MLIVVVYGVFCVSVVVNWKLLFVLIVIVLLLLFNSVMDLFEVRLVMVLFME